MTITLLFLPLRVCSCKLEHIAHKTYSLLNHLVFRPLSLAILINRKAESRSMSRSLKDHLFFLHFPLLFPTQRMSVTDVSLRIYSGIPIECSPLQIGCAQTTAPGTVALGSSRRNLACLRRLCQLRLRARKVFCRAMKYSSLISVWYSKCSQATSAD